jgi:hypothetical protein
MKRGAFRSLRFSCALLVSAAFAPTVHAQTACELSRELPAPYAELARSGIHDTAPGIDPTAAGHGQILLGEDLLYHLPVFMTDPESHPHNFQVILRVEMPAAAAEALREDRLENPGVLYTAVPPVFAQTQLIAYAGHPHLAAFDQVELFRHHFERSDPPRVPIGETPMAIAEVLHFRQLAPGVERPDALAYILVRSGEEAYLAHLLSAPPDFDQLLRVGLDDATVAGPLYLRLGDRPNAPEARLAVGEALVCGGPEDALQVEILEEVYCEVGEVSKIDAPISDQEDCPAT